LVDGKTSDAVRLGVGTGMRVAVCRKMFGNQPMRLLPTLGRIGLAKIIISSIEADDAQIFGLVMAVFGGAFASGHGDGFYSGVVPVLHFTEL